MNMQLHLAANPERQTREHIQSIDDPPVSTVFDRHETQSPRAPRFTSSKTVAMVLTGTKSAPSPNLMIAA